MSGEPIEVNCSVRGFGWECRVYLSPEIDAVEYLVTVSRAELDRFAPGEYEPTRLVEESFRFLLAREPKESIMRSFSLSTIERYFSEYAGSIRQLTR